MPLDGDSACADETHQSKLDSKDFQSICLRMKDILNDMKEDPVFHSTVAKGPPSRILSLPNPSLPVDNCAVLSPSLIWENEFSLFQLDDIELTDRIGLIENQGLLEVLLGLPRRHTGMSKLQFYNLPVVSAFATTLILRDFYPEYIHRLKKRLFEAFPESRYVEQDSSQISSNFPEDPLENGSEPRVFVVHYKGHNYLVQYAPFFVVYTVLLLYVYLSVSKIDMVKSKFGLAVSACFTVVASLGMSMSLCVAVGLMSPALRGREFFPYLVVLIGFENLVAITKSVVATPINLPVKYRVAQGLAKEGWPITKNLLCEFFCIALGFLTFDSVIQEFCLIAMISLTTDFFLQMFFFVTVLSVDIRRMELTDLQWHSDHTPDGNTGTAVCHVDGEPFTAPLRFSELPIDPYRHTKSSMHECTQGLCCHRRARSDGSRSTCTAIPPPNAMRTLVPAGLRFWANRRVIQSVGMVVIVIWLVMMLCYALIPTPGPTKNPPSEEITLLPRYQKLHRSSQHVDDITLQEDSVDEEQIFGMRSLNRHGFEMRWDSDTLWRHMAFSTWPAIADHYNLSLADRRLVVFEPIHVVQRFRPSEAILSRPNTPFNLFEEGRINHAGGEDHQVSAAPDVRRPLDDQDFEGDRTWWSHVLSLGHKEVLATLGLPWSGLLDWTSRLSSTAEMISASVLGASFFFALTTICMLLVHRQLSNFKPNNNKEPVARILQLNIPLCDEMMVSGDDWIIACGSHDSVDTNLLWTGGLCNSSSSSPRRHSAPKEHHSGEIPSSIIATAFSGLGAGVNALHRSIRLWSAECGHLVATFDRFSPEYDNIRKTRRYSAVWSMKVLVSTGQLFAGCSNGTIEVWDLHSYCLRQIINLGSTDRFFDDRGTPMDTACLLKRVGGVTVMEPSLENQNVFFVGTTTGLVGYMKWDIQTSPPPHVSRSVSPRRPEWSIEAVWVPHPVGKGVSFLAPQRPNPNLQRLLPPALLKPFSAGSVNGDCVFISGAEDGSLALIQTNSLHFSRFTWDSSPVRCVDFLQNTAVISYASGNIRMLTISHITQVDKEQMHPKLHVEMSPLAMVSDDSDFPNPSAGACPNEIKKLGGPVWVRLFSTSSPLSSSMFRLVTYYPWGYVAVWSIVGNNSLLMGRFPANRPTFALPTPIICVDDRVIFGDKGYLRLVNPRTAKYERSVQLLTPSPSVGSSMLQRRHQWVIGLGPLGVARGTSRQFIVGLADGAQTLVVMPKSALVN